LTWVNRQTSTGAPHHPNSEPQEAEDKPRTGPRRRRRIDFDQGKAGVTRPACQPTTAAREQVMPAGEMLFVAAFIVAFGIFAIVLGWADRRTRQHQH
jgi:hypothetical protein